MRFLRIKPRQVPQRADQVLSLLKYGVLVLVLVMTWRINELWFRGYDPCYALISRHGEDIMIWAYVVAGAIVVGSLVVTMPFCRWLCPFAVVLNLFSRFSLTRIRRNEESCTGCKHCTRVCPMNIPVHQVQVVTHARCMNCMDCVEACDTLKFNALEWGPSRRLTGPWPKPALAGILAVCIAGSVALSYAAPLPSFTRSRGEAPSQTQVAHLKIEGLSCRGSAVQFTERYLFRGDAFAVPGYLRLDAWPGPGKAYASVTYDPAQTTPAAIMQAIAEAVYDAENDMWRPSPFVVDGYDPLAAIATSEPGP